MGKRTRTLFTRIRAAHLHGGGALVAGCLLLLAGCNLRRAPQIAVIPRTAGEDLWDTMLVGADSAARARGLDIYWNAPAREDDVQGQIDLVERIVEKGYDGLILSPDQSLALMMPVRNALSHKIPVVIVGSPLPLPAGGRLSYVLNDDEEGGRLAAQRAGLLLHGRGAVAIVGIDPDIHGVMTRTRSFEVALAKQDPGVSIVAKRMGAFNVPQEQEAVEEILEAHPSLNVIVAVTAAATRGAYLAITARKATRRVKLIGFDQDLLAPLQTGGIDAVIVQNTYQMGRDAIRLIDMSLHGKTVPTILKLEPVLVTRENLTSPQVERMLSVYWRPRP